MQLQLHLLSLLNLAHHGATAASCAQICIGLEIQATVSSWSAVGKTGGDVLAPPADRHGQQQIATSMCVLMLLLSKTHPRVIVKVFLSDYSPN
jgi:hypothetical protein